MNKLKFLKNIIFITAFSIVAFSLNSNTAFATNKYWVGGGSNSNWNNFVDNSRITIGNGPSNVVFTPSGTFAYVSNLVDDNVSVIRTSDRTVVATIPVSNSPTGITITPNSSYVYVVNSGDHTVSVIRTSDNTVVGSPITVGNTSGFSTIVATPDSAYVYVANSNDNTISVIRTSDNTVISTITVGFNPIVAITPDGSYVYSVSPFDGSVYVVRTSDNTVVGSPIVVTTDTTLGNISITPNGLYAYVVRGDNSISVIRLSDNTVIGTPIVLENNANSIAFTPDGAYAYVSLDSSNTVSVIRTYDTTVIANVTLLAVSITGLAVIPGGAYVYVADNGGNSVSFIDTSTNATIPVVSNWSATSGGTQKTAIPTSSDDVFFDANSGTGTSTISAVINIGSFDTTGYRGTIVHTSGSLGIFGAVANFSNTMTYSPSAGTAVTFPWSSVATITLTTSGKTFNNITKSGTSTLRLADNLTIGSGNTLSFTNGTFDANDKNVTVGIFSSTGTNARTLTMGTGTWSITGNNATVWNLTNTTGLTINRGNPVILNYSGSTGTRTIVNGTTGGSEATAPDLSIIGGSDSVAITASSLLRNLNFTGFSGTLTNTARSIYGNLTISPTMTVSAGTNVTTFAGTSGTQTITSNGKTLDFPLTFNGTGGTFLIGDNLSVGATTSRAVTLTAGTLNLNGKTLTNFGTFTPGAGSTTRSVAFNGGMYNITSTTATTVWNYSGTNFTTSGAGTIKISGSTTNNRTFAGGGATYPDLVYTNATGNGQLTISGSNTFNNLQCTDTNTQTILFTAGTNTTVSRFTVAGGPSNLITLNSTSTATYALTKSGQSIVFGSDYLNIQHSVATPANTWYAGTHSTDNQATSVAGSGWVFTVPPADTTAPVTTPSPVGSLYGVPQSVTLSCLDAGGYGCDNIYYTTDGTTPTASSATYASPVSLLSSGILKFFARDFASNSEPVNIQTYTIDMLSPTADITYSLDANAATIGKTNRIIATFNEPLLDSPVVNISISGNDTLPATPMTKIDSTHYYYDYPVTGINGEGTDIVTLSVGTDLIGNVVIPNPTSGGSFKKFRPRYGSGVVIAPGGGGSGSYIPPATISTPVSSGNTNPTPAVLVTITRTLQVSFKGEDVKLLQKYLKLTPDGTFGPKTKQAVIKFQKAHKLGADGVVGPKTRKALEAML